MEAPSYPEYVDAELKKIREAMHLRWNPAAKVVRPGQYDPYGNLIPPKLEGRYEVWDKDAEGGEYRVMLVQTDKGEFRLPSQWLVDTLNLFNPNRWKGDLKGMLDHLYAHQERLREIEEKDFNNLLDAACGDWADYAVLHVPSAGIPNQS